MSHPSTSTGVQAGQPHVNVKESRLNDRLEKIDKAATAVLDNYLRLFEHAKASTSRSVLCRSSISLPHTNTHTSASIES